MFEMGIPQTMPGPYELESSFPTEKSYLEDLSKEIYSPYDYSYDTQGTNVPSPGISGTPSLPEYCQAGMATSSAPDPNCVPRFRDLIADDCARARFYARALEFYLLDNEQQNAELRCPLASCPQSFTDTKPMLLHLKNCRHFAQGKFFCPTCRRDEPFQVRSGKRCSWHKEQFGHKLLRISKDVFRSVVGNHKICAKGQPPIPAALDDRGVHYDELDSSSTEQEALPDNQSDPRELASPVPSLELPSEPMTYASLIRSKKTCTSLVSEPFSEARSNDTSPTETNISLSSPTQQPELVLNRRHNSTSIVDRSSHRLASLYDGSNIGELILVQPLANRYQATSTVQDFDSFVPPINFPAQDSTGAGSQISPLLPNHLPGSRSLPKLVVDTSDDPIFQIGDIPSMQGLAPMSESLYYPATAPAQPAPVLFPETTTPHPNHPVRLETDVSGCRPVISEPNSSTNSSSSTSMLPTISLQRSRSSPPPKGRHTCRKCRRPFTKKNYRNKHERTHRNIRISCFSCPKTFSRRDNMVTHYRKVHDSTSPLPSKQPHSSSDSS
ncbi:hypothetical protein F4777DRAFT_318441 [Nemania sp. FL0916]|nr:hypothetical protein F4777DRAFT_318441 [Nemania sp. FL0916]